MKVKVQFEIDEDDLVERMFYGTTFSLILQNVEEEQKIRVFQKCLKRTSSHIYSINEVFGSNVPPEIVRSAFDAYTLHTLRNHDISCIDHDKLYKHFRRNLRDLFETTSDIPQIVKERLTASVIKSSSVQFNYICEMVYREKIAPLTKAQQMFLIKRTDLKYINMKFVKRAKFDKKLIKFLNDSKNVEDIIC